MGESRSGRRWGRREGEPRDSGARGRIGRGEGTLGLSNRAWEGGGTEPAGGGIAVWEGPGGDRRSREAGIREDAAVAEGR